MTLSFHSWQFHTVFHLMMYKVQMLICRQSRLDNCTVAQRRNWCTELEGSVEIPLSINSTYVHCQLSQRSKSCEKPWLQKL